MVLLCTGCFLVVYFATKHRMNPESDMDGVSRVGNGPVGMVRVGTTAMLGSSMFAKRVCLRLKVIRPLFFV